MNNLSRRAKSQIFNLWTNICN